MRVKQNDDTDPYLSVNETMVTIKFYVDRKHGKYDRGLKGLKGELE